MATNKVLLLGAGFSKNWGGWLAGEVYSELLVKPQLRDNPDLKALLQHHQREEQGFESALMALEEQYHRSGLAEDKERLDLFIAAVLGMFADMNKRFVNTGNFHFEFPQKSGMQAIDFQVSRFMAGFDAIFTLNQDILLERNYLRLNVGVNSQQRWSDAEMPGMREMPDTSGAYPKDWLRAQWKPDLKEMKINPRFQPYVKLHGSSQWIDGNNEPILIMGGGKDQAISSHGILEWYHKLFAEYLGKPNTRLVIIGYGFRDEHITQAIRNAGAGKNLEMYVIDKLGENVLDGHEDLLGLVGGERRCELKDIFSGDTGELAQLQQFLGK